MSENGHNQSAPIAPLDFADMNSTGWVAFDLPWSDEATFNAQLLSFASQLGTPVPTRPGSGIFDILIPRRADVAHPNSLSKIYDVGEFPLHIDTAHWLNPCRYILMGCIAPGLTNRCTNLLDTKRVKLNDWQVDLLYRSPFRVRNGRRSFFSTILSKDRQFVRLDPGCMSPASDDGFKALNVYSESKQEDSIDRVKWKTGRVLLLDNWRVLHGRAAGHGLDPDRKQLRISIL